MSRFEAHGENEPERIGRQTALPTASQGAWAKVRASTSVTSRAMISRTGSRRQPVLAGDSVMEMSPSSSIAPRGCGL